MEYFELVNTVYLLKDIPYEYANEEIGKFINMALSLDNELGEWHKQNCYKFYVYNSFYPIESKKIYKAGSVYKFKIRSLNKEFVSKMKELLTMVECNYLKIIMIQEKVFKQRYIVGL